MPPPPRSPPCTLPPGIGRFVSSPASCLLDFTRETLVSRPQRALALGEAQPPPPGPTRSARPQPGEQRPRGPGALAVAYGNLEVVPY